MKWSPKEVALLHLKYPSSTWTELLSIFPNRGRRSIKLKANKEGLKRDKFSIKKGLYFKFAMCPIHGRIDRTKIVWKNRKHYIGYCPYCNSRLKLLPTSSKLREKYRGTKNV